MVRKQKIEEMNRILGEMMKLVSQLKELEDIRSGKSNTSEDDYWHMAPHLNYHAHESDIDKRLYLMLQYYDAREYTPLVKIFGEIDDIILALHIAVQYKRRNEYLEKHLADVERQLGRKFSTDDEGRKFIADKNSRARLIVRKIASYIVTVTEINKKHYVSYEDFKKMQNIAREFLESAG